MCAPFPYSIRSCRDAGEEAKSQQEIVRRRAGTLQRNAAKPCAQVNRPNTDRKTRRPCLGHTRSAGTGRTGGGMPEQILDFKVSESKEVLALPAGFLEEIQECPLPGFGPLRRCISPSLARLCQLRGICKLAFLGRFIAHDSPKPAPTTECGLFRRGEWYCPLPTVAGPAPRRT